MQNQLFQLILLGQFSFLICELHHYVFIESRKSWCEARAYCKANYTDMASVPNVKFMKKLQKTHQKNIKNEAAWIGLRRVPQQQGMWKWSQPWVESDMDWASGEPNNPNEKCATMDGTGLRDIFCRRKHKFICYNETNQGKEQFYVSNDNKSWYAAQNYCREHHSDLATQLSTVKKMLKLQDKYWIGLFRDNWAWLDNSNSPYRDWSTYCEETQKEMCNGNCAVSLPNKSEKWQATVCGSKKPFICYKDNVKLIKQEEDWDAAFEYCKNNHRALVSIVTSEDQSWIQEKAREANTDHIWLGLQYSCPLDLWFWLNDMVSDESLFNGQKAENCDTVVAMSKKGKYKLFSKAENLKYNFVCSL